MIRSQNPGPCEGFDEFAGKTWIYPNNMPVRGYQKAAVELALFNNAMIVLPTGFGKTFIAAVVMYNFYLWYPQGKIIFVAPTRPLVAQQIEECRKVSGIPARDSIELTGKTPQLKRQTFWETKRVFFATPQVIENDLANNLLPSKSVKCIVIDEAHKAQGGYAYVNIVRHLHENNRNGFRVLALSATPGSDITRVQQVMLNLYINEVMFRSEHSIDLMQFGNNKNSKAWTVDLTGKHREFVDKFIKMTDPIFKELHRAGLTYSQSSIDRVSKYCLIKGMEAAKRNDIPRPGVTKGKVTYLCASGIALSSKFELLTLYGLRVFYSSCMSTLNESRSSLRTITAGKVEFDVIINEIRQMFGDEVEPDPTKKPTRDLVVGHPKLSVVRDLLMKHFQEHEGTETRVIVFSKYRESVYDIVQTMRYYEPVIKPAAFVGQGNGAKSGGQGGMTQKDQIDLIKKFKAGVYNVLVATCVAEEGLDIGEVDLIICYDTSSSPISTTQRRGRTGRKRSGNVQTICTKGYEEKKLQDASRSRRLVEEQLFKKENYTTHKYRDAPRMVPSNVHPVCVSQWVEPSHDLDEIQEASTSKGRRRRRDEDEGEDEIDGDITPSMKKKKGTSKKITPLTSSKKSKANKSFSEDDELNTSDEDIFTPSTAKFTSAKSLLESQTSGTPRAPPRTNEGFGTPKVNVVSMSDGSQEGKSQTQEEEVSVVYNSFNNGESNGAQPVDAPVNEPSNPSVSFEDDDDVEWDDEFEAPPQPVFEPKQTSPNPI